MKKKKYVSPIVKVQPMPKGFGSSVTGSNLQEQKHRFLKHGKTPIFVLQGDTSTVEELATKTSGKIRFDLLGEAEYILRQVKQNFGMGENYLEHTYGPRIEQDEANEILFDYIRENGLQESLSVYWSNDMTCSASMNWRGYSFKCNKPEARRYSLWLNGTAENPYLRRHGLRCLLDHEIGTHFYRSYNDGLQPWFYDRKKFGLRGTGSFESLCTEEGFAAINTVLRAKEKYLWLSALVYYTACKSTEMTFKQLFDHLGQFVQNPEQRWKHVMRVKRGLLDPNDLGGYGKDQCYFEGAVGILRNVDNINFTLLMSGKICYDEVSRVKRVARLGSICLPAIMRDMESYRQQLKKMAVINGLHLTHPSYGPSRSYLQRLKERQAGTSRQKKVRKRKKSRASVSTDTSGSSGSRVSSQSFETTKEFTQDQGHSCSKLEDFRSCDIKSSLDPDVSGCGASSLNDPGSARHPFKKESDTYLESIENAISLKSTNNPGTLGLKDSGSIATTLEKDVDHSEAYFISLDSKTPLATLDNMSFYQCGNNLPLRSVDNMPFVKSVGNAPSPKAFSQLSCTNADNFSTEVFVGDTDSKLPSFPPLPSAKFTTRTQVSMRITQRPRSAVNELRKIIPQNTC